MPSPFDDFLHIRFSTDIEERHIYSGRLTTDVDLSMIRGITSGYLIHEDSTT